MRKTRPSEQGLSLVEVMVALLIVTPILIMVIGVFFRNVQGVTESWEETWGTAAGQRLMGNVCRMRWDEQTPFGGTVVVPSPIGIDGAETTNPATFDDIDDWNGFSAPDPLNNRYTRSVRVEFVTVNTGTGEVTAVAGPTDYKRITVTVSGPGGKTIEISTLRTNSRP